MGSGQIIVIVRDRLNLNLALGPIGGRETLILFSGLKVEVLCGRSRRKMRKRKKRVEEVVMKRQELADTRLVAWGTIH